MNFFTAIKRSTNVALGALCLLSLIGTTNPLTAQHNHNHPGRTCHAMENLEHRESINPKLNSKMSAIEQHTQRVIQSGEFAQGRNGVITIPVVVHVMYNNSNENISDAQIQSQIDVLNEDYRKEAGTPGYNSHPDGADIGIEFVLANRDPNGNVTTGITRKQVSRASWGTNDDMKKTSQGGVAAWPSSSYLNMWICNIGQSILGYAQFPGGAASTDGVVMSPQYFGSSDKGSGFYLANGFDKGRTTTHEVGHWLNLRHIWGDGGCGVDDFVGDTPESDAANYGCPSGHKSCSTTDMVENYMDYTDDACMNIFTQGQKDRMLSLFSSGGFRSSLLNSAGYVSGGSTGGGGSTTFCSSAVQSFPYSQGFENGLGDWSQASNDNIDWTNKSGGTGSSGTGASSAAEGSYYMYVEASNPNYPSKVATLNSPCFDLGSASTAQLSFQFHMYGSDMGTLELQASSDGSNWSTLWSKSGDQGNAWASADADLSAYVGGNVQLRFKGTTGGSYRGDMTVDDFNLTTTTGSNTGGGNTGGGNTGSSCVDGKIDLSITTDQYGSETSWTLKDANGTTIESGSGYANSTSIDLNWNLADGNYTFEIVDEYGDGMCCSYGNGAYSINSGGTNLASGGDYGKSESTTFCVENASTGGGTTGGCPTIDFNTYPVISYGGSQDAGNFDASDPTTVVLTGNSWKAIDYNYTVTANTVIEFEFGSTTQGEIHGIGFDNDNAISSDKTFRLYGTQSWGLANYDDYATSAGSWKAYAIPVGQFYTGTFSKLFFANDDDANKAGNSYFRNIKIYEGSCGAKGANLEPEKYATAILQNQGENDFTVKIYPNPASNVLNVELDTYDEGIDATIIDATGRQIWSEHLDRGVNNINVSNLAPGMYNFTAVQPNGQYITKKFVKK
ncbi:MAG: T9SS type A sorting domain-containing protein [Aureispira sp.]|nr:T9SS type A sorting domain-containing protein [Aureispira sp.]